MKIRTLKNNLLLFCLISLLTIIHTGCELTKTEPEIRIVASVGLTLDEVDDNAIIEVEVGEFLESYVSFYYYEGISRIDPLAVSWKTTLKDDPNAPLDAKIKIKTTEFSYRVDVEDFEITEPVELVVTANKGDNKTASRIIRVKPKS